MLLVRPISAFSDNYIWVACKDAERNGGNSEGASTGAEIWVVDPGDAQPVLSYMQQTASTLGGILITHHHFDHVGGVESLVTHNRNLNLPCPVYGPASESIPCRTQALREGDEVSVLGQSWKILDLPGHTAGHIAYFCPEADVLFCGDTLFSAGCGRLFEGTPGQMRQSLSKLLALPDTTARLLHPRIHHGQSAFCRSRRARQ